MLVIELYTLMSVIVTVVKKNKTTIFPFLVTVKTSVFITKP